VTEQRVEHVQRLARGRRDQPGVERAVAIRQMRVDLESWALAVVRVQPPGGAAEAGRLEELAIR
jgi:hypothetical protein